MKPTFLNNAGLSHAIAELQDEQVKVRRNAVIVCILSGDPRVIEPLKSVFEDEDFEVRFYARQGVKRLENQIFDNLSRN